MLWTETNKKIWFSTEQKLRKQMAKREQENNQTESEVRTRDWRNTLGIYRIKPPEELIPTESKPTLESGTDETGSIKINKKSGIIFAKKVGLTLVELGITAKRIKAIWDK